MRMIPPIVGDATKSMAEREVFRWLQDTDLGEGCYALHSLNISEHDYKKMCELDFLVISRRGILVLEVKGGEVRRDSGVWTFTTRYGKVHRRSEGPFDQARSGMFALSDQLEKQFGARLHGVVLGYGVAFPDKNFDVTSPEWAPEMVFDARMRHSPNGFQRFMDRLYVYWTSKQSHARLMDPSQIRELIQYVRPSFDRVPPLSVRVDRLSQTMAELTEEQYAQLDCMEENPRIICSGGAGTGKTFLAAELARRQAARGKTVLVACASPVLAAYLRSVLKLPTVTVEVVGTGTASMIGKRGDRVGALVVDEGQDLMNAETLDYLDRQLVGGLEAGEWCFFLDANRQTGLTGEFDPAALDYLKSCGATLGRLSRNCRNTQDVITQTQLLTGADLGQPTAGQGPPVKFEYFTSSEGELELLEAELTRLRESGIAPGDITVLSPLPFAESCARNLSAAAKKQIQVLTAESAAHWPLSRVTFATVTDFKGLENAFILLTDITAIDEGVPLNVVYVGMSRARIGLWIGVDARLKSRLSEMMRGHLQSITTGAMKASANKPQVVSAT